MNDIDALMSRIEEINAKDPTELSSTDIDDLIAYHRRARARKASGEKSAPATRADVTAILNKIIPKAPVVKINRRI